jgi:hypothetical protein
MPQRQQQARPRVRETAPNQPSRERPQGGAGPTGEPAAVTGDRAQPYHRKAAQCRAMAESAISADERARWLGLAEDWLRLAESTKVVWGIGSRSTS